ncbi:MAG: DUF2341 domain-containing protein [Nannocystaceae bacterium]
MRWRLLQCGALAAGVACGGSDFFVCSEDADCAGAGEQGICQPAGACSVPDSECTSGQRYVEGSEPSLAEDCVPAGEGSTGSAEGSTGTETDGTTGERCPEQWWDCAWAHRQRLGLVRTPDTPLTDVPVLVLLTQGRIDHERMQADGEDLRFVSASGMPASYEIERWNPEGISTVWVTVDELSASSDHLWMYYGNPVAENAQDSAQVWAAPFVGVWHLEDDPLDSTGNGNDASVLGSTAVAAAQIADGRDFMGTDARLDVEPSSSLADLFMGGGTISGWFRARSYGGSGLGRIMDKGSLDAGWTLYIADSGQLRFIVEREADDFVTWSTPSEELGLLQWTHVALSWDALQGSIPRVFIDGAERPLVDPVPPPLLEELLPDEEVPLTFGNRVANNRRFDGVLDELRIERTVRSPAWIRLQYESMRDALLQYGPIESWEQLQ